LKSSNKRVYQGFSALGNGPALYCVPIADNFEYFYLKALDEERRSNHVVHMQLQKTTAELNEYKNLCEQFEFKKQNYDRIKS